MTLQEVLSQWPQVLACFAGGMASRPTYSSARKAVVALARAIVAHEDGDDVTAIADIKDAVEDVGQIITQTQKVPPIPEVQAPPPGTVKLWK